VGEWLFARHQQGLSVRARYRENRIAQDNGKTKIEKSYDLYIDRAMIEAEFDALWAKQSELNPALFHDTARDELHQRRVVLDDAVARQCVARLEPTVPPHRDVDADTHDRGCASA
jgi:hypothetical protein